MGGRGWACGAPDGLRVPKRESVNVLVHADRRPRQVELDCGAIGLRAWDPARHRGTAATECWSRDPRPLRRRCLLARGRYFEGSVRRRWCHPLARAPRREHPPPFCASEARRRSDAPCRSQMALSCSAESRRSMGGPSGRVEGRCDASLSCSVATADAVAGVSPNARFREVRPRREEGEHALSMWCCSRPRLLQPTGLERIQPTTEPDRLAASRPRSSKIARSNAPPLRRRAPASG